MNKYLKLLLPIILFFILTVNSCVTEDCDGFPQENLIHVPYQIDEILYFENGKDTISFTVVESGITEPYEIKTSFPATSNDECEYYAFFKTSRESIYGYLIKDGYHDYHRVEFSIDEHLDVYEMLNENTFLSEEELDSIIINNIQYENVYSMEKDSNIHNARIIKVLKAPNHGIIQFIDNFNGLTWNKIK